MMMLDIFMLLYPEAQRRTNFFFFFFFFCFFFFGKRLPAMRGYNDCILVFDSYAELQIPSGFVFDIAFE